MSIKLLLLRGGFGGGGGSADFIFMGARIFLNFARSPEDFCGDFFSLLTCLGIISH